LLDDSVEGTGLPKLEDAEPTLTTGERGENLDGTSTALENKVPWPSLSSLLREDDGEIIGDVQFLLDFAIVGRKHPIIFWSCCCRLFL